MKTAGVPPISYEAVATANEHRYYEELAQACNNDIRFADRKWQETSGSVREVTSTLEFLTYYREIGGRGIQHIVATVFRVREYQRRKPRLIFSPEQRRKLRALQNKITAQNAELKQLKKEHADKLETLLSQVVELCLAKPKKRVSHVGVDCLFTSLFDNQFRARVSEIRSKFMGRDTRFESKEKACHWIDELAGLGSKQPILPPSGSDMSSWGDLAQSFDEKWQIFDEFNEELDKLAQDYNFDNTSVLNHVLMGDFLRPLTHKIRLERTENNRPYLDLRIYHPESLILLNRDLFTSKRLNNYKAELSAPRRPKRKSMLLTTLLRTLFIYFLSRQGGGAVTQKESISRWNTRFPHYKVSLRQYQREKLRLLSERRAPY